MKKYKPTWLHHLFLGTYQLETGNVDDARISFQASINLKPNVHAYRNLALFAPTANDAFDLFTSAWLSWKLLDLLQVVTVLHMLYLSLKDLLCHMQRIVWI